MADVEAVDGRYLVRSACLVEAPLEVVRGLLADDRRLAEWVPNAEPGTRDLPPAQVRLEVGAHVGPTGFVGETVVEVDGTVVRRWALAAEPDRWQREVRYTARFVPGGTHLDVEVATTIPGAAARDLRMGGRLEAKGLERALADLSRRAEGRDPARRRLRGRPPPPAPSEGFLVPHVAHPRPFPTKNPSAATEDNQEPVLGWGSSRERDLGQPGRRSWLGSVAGAGIGRGAGSVARRSRVRGAGVASGG